MFNKKVLAASMAVAMAGGIATTANAMNVAHNGVGQVLMGATFFAQNGFSTEIAVANVRTDAAVLAKVVFRSHEKSVEILDFMIYLSPGDVWRGTVSKSATTGLGHIYSADDSVRDATDTAWGSATALDVDFFAHNVTSSTDSTDFGHFEIITVAAAGAGTYTVPGVTVKQGMSKDDHKKLFETASLRATTATGLCTPAELNAAQVWSATAPCSSQLLGEVRVESATTRATYHPTAMTNDTNYVASTYVNANPALSISTATETLIGAGMSPTGGEWVQEFEAALSANASQFIWENNTTLSTDGIITFPTKYRHYGDTVNGVCGVGGTGGLTASATTNYSAPFQDTTIGEMQYSFTSFDNSENSEVAVTVGSSISGAPTTVTIIAGLKDEVNYVNPTFFASADSGQAYYAWKPRTSGNCAYTGAPLAAYTYKFDTATGGNNAFDAMGSTVQ